MLQLHCELSVFAVCLPKVLAVRRYGDTHCHHPMPASLLVTTVHREQPSGASSCDTSAQCVRLVCVGSGPQRRVEIIVDAHAVLAYITLLAEFSRSYVSRTKVASRNSVILLPHRTRMQKHNLTNVFAFVQKWMIKRGDLFVGFCYCR